MAIFDTESRYLLSGFTIFYLIISISEILLDEFFSPKSLSYDILIKNSGYQFFIVRLLKF